MNLSDAFVKCVRGYHLINDDPIKETPWEDINAQILVSAGCTVESKSNGSHKSGKDIQCSLGDFSNKSTQYDMDGTSFQLSSYRLTAVCSDKEPGKVEDFIAEINKRKNFKFYSIIVRAEVGDSFKYDWYLLPSDLPALNPESYTWEPKIGKVGKKKDQQVGWKTNVRDGSSMDITFSMSSQLWMSIKITEDMKEHIKGSVTVKRGRKYNYIQLYDLLTYSQFTPIKHDLPSQP